jgi:hypothetical protein
MRPVEILAAIEGELDDAELIELAEAIGLEQAQGRGEADTTSPESPQNT